VPDHSHIVAARDERDQDGKERIAEAHGGRIWVEPDAGPGVTFAFTLLPAGS